MASRVGRKGVAKETVARLRAGLVSQIDMLAARGPSLKLDELRAWLATLDDVRAKRGVAVLAKRVTRGGPWALVVNVDMTKSLLTGEHQGSIWAKDVANAARVRAVRSVQAWLAMGPPYAPLPPSDPLPWRRPPGWQGPEQNDNVAVYFEAGVACALLSGVRDVTPAVIEDYGAKLVAALPAARQAQVAERQASKRADADAERIAEIIVEAVTGVPADTLHSSIYGRREKTPKGRNTPKVYRRKVE